MCCKTKESKDSRTQRTVKAVTEVEETTAAADDYAFHVNTDAISGEGNVTLDVGGVLLCNVLIDSGATCNLIDEDTWCRLKADRIKCSSKMCSKQLFAYAQAEPIKTCGTFTCDVYCNVVVLSNSLW